MTKYKAIITTTGAAKIAAATAGGTQLKITHMAVGDGNGTLPEPTPEQTKLINEQYRATLNALDIANASKDHIVAELIIPANVGGFWLREMGLFDESGELIAVGNMAESYKPKLEEGSGRTQTLRMILIVSNTDAIQVIAGDDTVLASRDFVEKALLEHEGSRRHPDATTTAKGFVMLSNATNSPDENKAVTPAALKQVNDAVLKKALNLSDVPNKETARRNLQLGSAATKNVGTESGQLMAVGAFGLGGAAININDANAVSKTGFYKLAPGAANTPNSAANWEMLCIKYDATSAKQLFWHAGANTTRTYIRYCTSPAGVWGPFQQYYSTENKPTSADVGAWSKNEADGRYLQLTGGKVSGKTEFSNGIYVGEDTSLNKNLFINGYSYVEKRGNVDDLPNNYRNTAGYRIWGAGDLFVDLYHGERIGQHHFFGIHVANGGADGWYEFRNGGEFIAGSTVGAGGGDGSKLHSDGNISGSLWGGYLFNYINNRTHVAGGRNAWWYKDEASGLIFQGGIVNRASDVTWVGFPIGYQRECFGIQMTLHSRVGDSSSNIEARNPQNGGFDAVMFSNERQAFWWAVGV